MINILTIQYSNLVLTVDNKTLHKNHRLYLLIISMKMSNDSRNM
jgi:hypothetical protein